MGLSLRNVTKKVTTFFGGHPQQQRPQPGPIQPAQQPGQIMGNRSPVSLGKVQIRPVPPPPRVNAPDPVGRFVGGIGHAAAGVIRTDIVNPARIVAAQVTHNPVAERNANIAQSKSIAAATPLIHGFTRIVPEVATTLFHPGPTAYHPNSPFEQALFGKEPVQNIQQKVVTNFQDHKNLPLPQRIGLAGLEGAASIAQDAPVAGALARTGVAGTAGIKAGATFAKEQKLAPLDQAGKLRLPAVFGGSPSDSFHYSSTDGYTKISGKADAVHEQLAKLANDQSGKVQLPGKTPDGMKRVGSRADSELVPVKYSKPSLAADNVKPGTNPYKTTARDIQPGDYAGARLAPQQLTYPVKVIAGRFDQAMGKLQKADPGAWSDFWRHVEKPPKNPSPELQNAMYWWREGADRINAHANAYGKQTSYLKNFALHPWQLGDVTPEQLAGGGPGLLGKHAIQRKYQTIAQGEARGLTLGADPTAEGLKYLHGGSNAVGRLIAKDALKKADAGETLKPHTLDLGWGHSVQLSDKGMRGGKALQAYTPTSNKAIKGLRTANVAVKSAILSYGQFHPFNIAAMRAGPSVALKGHPVRAAVGVGRAFRPLLPGGKGFVDKVLTKAYQDGMIDKAAEMGMPYGEAGYNVAGTSLKSGVGHKLVFERQMPMMHDQVVRAIVSDLEKKNISLSSEEARQAGIVGNATMGFINKEALNISPQLRQKMSDWMLAGQYTPSKVVTLSKVGKRGVAGGYARTDVVSNAISALGLVAGIGYVSSQKSDSVRDMILRALVDPAAPTPWKDKKGNTVEIGLPATYTGEISKLLGIHLERGKDGHLHPKFSAPKDMPAGIIDWTRSRLSPLPGDILKVGTNIDYATKHLFDPKASLKTKVAQGATTIAAGSLPIGAQGIPYLGAVKNRLPQDVKDVLDANTPGANPLAKSGLSSVGFRVRTDNTVGKSKDTSQYFAGAKWAIDQAKNTSEQTALENYLGTKKNPITGKYDVMPNPNDSGRKAKDLVDAPRTIDILIEAFKKIKDQGGKVDPLWTRNKAEITAYLQYQDMPYGGPDRKHWINGNKDWYVPLSKERTTFFDSLPKGDPNKPQQPIEYPSPTKAVAAKQEHFFKIMDSAERAKFLRDNPDVQQQFDKGAEYNNKMRVATLGPGSELDTFPKADPGLQKLIDAYNALPKHDGKKGGNKSRAVWIQSHPKEFAAITRYFTQASLYGLEEDASQAQFKDTGFSSKGLGEIYNIGKNDVKQGTDKSGNPVYALTTGQSGGATYTDQNGNTFADLGRSTGSSSGGSSGGFSNSGRRRSSGRSSGSSSGSNKAARISAKSANPYKYALSRHAGGKIAKPTVSVHLQPLPKAAAAKFSKPKVTLKKSKV